MIMKDKANNTIYKVNVNIYPQLQPIDPINQNSFYDASTFMYFGQNIYNKKQKVDLSKLIEELHYKKLKQKYDLEHLEEIERDDLKLSNLHKGLIIYLVYGTMHKLDEFNLITYENFHFYLIQSGIIPVSFNHLYLNLHFSQIDILKSLIWHLLNLKKEDLIKLCTIKNETWLNHQDMLTSHTWINNDLLLSEFNLDVFNIQ